MKGDLVKKAQVWVQHDAQRRELNLRVPTEPNTLILVGAGLLGLGLIALLLRGK